jgi:hypothetical protein
MAAELVFEPFEPIEDDPWDDSWHDGQVWSPSNDIDLEPILLQHSREEVPKIPSLKPSGFAEFAFRMPADDGVGDDGRGYNKFSFEGRRHMRHIYDTGARRILLKCARQVEKSTLLGNIALSYMSLIPSFRVLYVNSSSTQAKTFSNDRVKDPIETSLVLKRFTTKMLSSNVFEKQFINHSKITMRYAFLNADRCRGIPAWMLCVDEIQDILSNNIPVIEQCLSHAPDRWKRYLYSGTPKSLENTIETYWANKSTQNEWAVPHGCKGGEGGRFWNILGEKNIGKKGLICSNCGTLIDPQCADAQWAAMVAYDQELTPFEGYRIPQLMVPWKPWSEILHDYINYPRNRFYNEVLGISFDSGLRPLTRGQVKAACNPDVTMSSIDHYRQLAYSQPVFMGIDWGCHDEETRILTEEGFKYFRDLTEEDKVAQWDPDTREMTFVVPKARTVREWDQPLLHLKTQGGLDAMVTHTHRMRVGASQGAHWLTESAGELAKRGGNVKFVGYVGWAGPETTAFTLPGLPKSPGYSGSESRTFLMDDWLELLGYLISEGGLCFDVDRPSCLKMSQRQTVNFETYQKIQGCLDRMRIPFKAFPNKKTGDVNWTIYGKQFWSWYAENVGKTGDTKRVPRQFLKFSQRQLRILWQSLVDGDGTVDRRPNCTGGGYTSTSKGLCEDFQELCIKLGMRAVLRQHKAAEGNRKTQWRVSWSEGRDYQLNTPSRSIEKVPYRGKVYCCAVPSGYIVTERNGCVSYQGNTGENAYTVVALGTYVDGVFRIFFVHRFVGEDTEPDRQLERICELIDYFNVAIVMADYGGGFYPNNTLMRRFGNQRIHKLQWMARTNKKFSYDSKMGRWKGARTELMSDVFNAIKRASKDRKMVEFPRWEEFRDPYAQDMLNIFSEYNEQIKQIQYKHAMDKPDDTMHAVTYCLIASTLKIPRFDIFVPRREERGVPVSSYTGPVDQ